MVMGQVEFFIKSRINFMKYQLAISKLEEGFSLGEEEDISV
jgi:hypothetical protein